MPDLPPEPAGEELPAALAALRAANARLRGLFSGHPWMPSGLEPVPTG